MIVVGIERAPGATHFVALHLVDNQAHVVASQSDPPYASWLEAMSIARTRYDADMVGVVVGVDDATVAPVAVPPNLKPRDRRDFVMTQAELLHYTRSDEVTSEIIDESTFALGVIRAAVKREINQAAQRVKVEVGWIESYGDASLRLVAEDVGAIFDLDRREVFIRGRIGTAVMPFGDDMVTPVAKAEHLRSIISAAESRQFSERVGKVLIISANESDAQDLVTNISTNRYAVAVGEGIGASEMRFAASVAFLAASGGASHGTTIDFRAKRSGVTNEALARLVALAPRGEVAVVVAAVAVMLLIGVWAGISTLTYQQRSEKIFALSRAPDRKAAVVNAQLELVQYANAVKMTSKLYDAQSSGPTVARAIVHALLPVPRGLSLIRISLVSGLGGVSVEGFGARVLADRYASGLGHAQATYTLAKSPGRVQFSLSDTGSVLASPAPVALPSPSPAAGGALP